MTKVNTISPALTHQSSLKKIGNRDCQPLQGVKHNLNCCGDAATKQHLGKNLNVVA